MNKLYIDANQLLDDAFKLASTIYDSKFVPDLIVVVWRGGALVGLAIHEYFRFRQLDTDHITIRAQSYTGINKRSGDVKLAGMDYIYDNTGENSKLLIVDDVFDTGRSFKAIMDGLETHYGPAVRERTRTACPWYKPANNQTELVPDYYLHETADWLVFPHELVGLNDAEILQGKPAIGWIIG